jgi:chitin disaccharide deacetylase
MLIVNADDLGHDRATSDAICDIYARGRISSATAMVYMEDSARAFGLADEAGIPLGLHLNLMEPYSGIVPEDRDRAEQDWVVGRFQASFASRWLPGPKLFWAARRSVRAQLAEFERLRGGGPPTHVDGHQHGHLSTPALWTLNASTRPAVRSSFTFRPAEKPLHNRALRRVLNLAIASRFATTDRFHSIRDLHPALGGHGIEEVVAEARHRDVEVMVHPGIADEFELLTSEGWSRTIEGARLGSFADLPRVATPPC